MNYIEKIEQIKSLLKLKGYAALAADLTEWQQSGGTGGEVLMIVCSRLLGVKNNNPTAYAAIKAETEQLIKYANSIGLFPRQE